MDYANSANPGNIINYKNSGSYKFNYVKPRNADVLN